MKQRGFSTILILVGVLVVAIIAGGAYYFGKSQTPKSSPVPAVTSQTPQPTSVAQTTPSPTQVDETANWKIYTNRQYNFSIKYPSENWIVSADNEHEKRVTLIAEKRGGQISISFADSSLPLIKIKPEQLFKSESINVGGIPVKFDYAYTSVGGIIPVKDYNPQNYFVIATSDYDSLISHDSRFKSSIRQIGLNPLYNTSDVSLMIKILSTFKFTN